MKRICVLAMLFAVAFAINVYAHDFENLIPNISLGESEEVLGYSEFADVVKAVINGNGAEFEGIFKRIAAYFVKDLKDGAAYTAAIVGFAMLLACVKGVGADFVKNSSQVVFFVCYGVIAAFLLGILKTAYKTAFDTAEKITEFVKISVPAYVGIVSAAAPSVGKAELDGIFLLAVNVLSEFVGRFALNAFFMAGILCMANHMSSEVHIMRLVQLVRQIVFWILGFLLTVFAGMMGLSGINASSGAVHGINAVKYAIGHSVPIVGGFLADSSEMVFASFKIFKNSFGTAGIIVIFSLCAIPVVKLFCAGILLKFAAGITEPFCDKRICNCVADVGQTIIHIMICVILLTVMFVFSLSVILLIGVG